MSTREKFSRTIQRRFYRKAEIALTTTLSTSQVERIQDTALRTLFIDYVNALQSIVSTSSDGSISNNELYGVAKSFAEVFNTESANEGNCMSGCQDGLVECMESMLELALGENVELDPDNDKLEVETDEGSISLDMSKYDAEHSTSPSDDDDALTMQEALDRLDDPSLALLISVHCSLQYSVCSLNCMIPG